MNSISDTYINVHLSYKIIGSCISLLMIHVSHILIGKSLFNRTSEKYVSSINLMYQISILYIISKNMYLEYIVRRYVYLKPYISPSFFF